MTLITKAALVSILMLYPLSGYGFQPCKFHEINNTLPAFNLSKLKPGMSLATVERKLRQKIVFIKAPSPVSKNFKTSVINARNCVELRFYKNKLFGILVIYLGKQWADINELTAALSKELKVKTPWRTVLTGGGFEMRTIFLRKYQIEAQSTNFNYPVHIYNKKTMERLRKQLRNKKD